MSQCMHNVLPTSPVASMLQLDGNFWMGCDATDFCMASNMSFCVQNHAPFSGDAHPP